MDGHSVCHPQINIVPRSELWDTPLEQDEAQPQHSLMLALQTCST